jgi:hypothetical protein
MVWTSTNKRQADRGLSSFDHLLNLWSKPPRVVSRQIADALSIDLHHDGFRIMGIVGL